MRRLTRTLSISAFTFVELVFITLVLSILLVSAAPNFRGTWHGLQLERTAFAMAQMLRSARVVAIARGEPVVWEWDASANRAQLEVLQTQEHGHTEPVRLEGRLGQPYAMPAEVPLTVWRDQEPVQAIQFFPDGTSEATTLVFGEATDPSYHIEVDGATSRVALHAG